MMNFCIKTIILLQIVFLLSCSINTRNKKEDFSYPEYSSEIIWDIKTDFTTAYPNFYQEDNYLYSTEKIEQKGIFGFLSKINLLNGNYEWKSDEFPFSDLRSAPIVVNDYIFIHTHCSPDYFTDENGEDFDGCLYVFDKRTGKKLATIKLWITDEDYDFLTNTIHMISYDSKIIWAGYGVFLFDISQIDFSINPNKKQQIVPKRIWQDEKYDLNIAMHPVCDNGIIYFQTYDGNGYNYELPTRSRIIAYDINNETELWHYDCKKLYGYGRNNLIIVNDKLYIIEQGIGCFDLKTGRCYHESIQSLEDLMHEDDINGGIFSDGIAYHDGKFFYTNISSWSSSSITGIPEKNIHNIICLDAKTLKFVWGQLPKDSGSQSACPTVINGKVFIPLWLQGLCVLDEKTGQILGIDTSIISFGSAKSFTYNGIAYFMDYGDRRGNNNSSNQTRLVAIRP